MWSETKTGEQDKKVLGWRDFPAQLPGWNQEQAGASEIAAYLRRLLERYEESELIQYLVVPSPVALSGFFHCSESQVQEALGELQRQGYDVESTGSLGPLTLWDPLVRQKTHRPQHNSWDLFYEAFFPSSHRGREASF
jgi:hypothetical protein